ncbi:MAG: Spy/CpxP family protein refolding chaperone [Scytolyngbya sp. HA4215-MV1]|jgi:Spy/CpxP family protein refolding chaperone|nr:Spy/CpxP family protein refolding chaperone [Scytolyngbya sp. HA4215-MV1]
MKRSLIAILAGALVLVSPLVGTVVRAESLPVQSFSAQELPVLQGINLTPQQQAQLTQIRTQTRSQIQQILSTEQRNQFKSALEQGQGLQPAIAAMNLTPTQKTQLREVFRNARTQMSSTLTPEQKQQLLRNLRSQLMGSNR